MDRTKGCSRIEALKDYTVIDVETTGLDPKYDRIIEIAAAKVRNCEVCDTYSSLIDPQVPIDAFIKWKTGISNDMVAGMPTIQQAIEPFLAFIGQDILVGHNVNFDINFIYDSAADALGKSVGNDYIDTMRIARALHRDLPHHRLEDCLAVFGIQNDTAHRALPDCVATQRLYAALADELVEKGIPAQIRASRPRASLKDLVAESTDFDESGPVFGKVFVFTGTLELMLRKDAAQMVVNAGGQCGDNVTKKTNYLVLGNNDYCSTIKDGKSTKQKKAEDLISKGADLEILSEDAFYDMILE